MTSFGDVPVVVLTRRSRDPFGSEPVWFGIGDAPRRAGVGGRRRGDGGGSRGWRKTDGVSVKSSHGAETTTGKRELRADNAGARCVRGALEAGGGASTAGSESPGPARTASETDRERGL